MEFIENMAALRLNWKDIDENKTNTIVREETQEETEIKTHTKSKTRKTHW